MAEPNVFENKIALITGASGSIGFSIADKLAAYGAIPCLQIRKKEYITELAGKAKHFPNGHSIICADFVSDDGLKQFVDSFLSQYEQLDILVHSAGVIYLEAIHEMPLDHFDKQFKVNVRAPFYITQRLLPLLINNLGQIVFISSSAAMQTTWTNNGVYAATKLALRGIVESFRNEVNSKGVRVLSIYPGRTSSRMQEYVHQLEGKKYRPQSLLQPEDVANVVINALQLPRTAEVTDISIRPRQKF